MTKVKVNGNELEVQAGMTVLQACEQAGIEIPRFCYHERLSIAGNCRMCLVEVKPGPPKPQASCALPVSENMEIFTNTDMVVKARQGVMEFLLMNHPLDCPICDQGGECDLQDQAMGYGRAFSRFDEPKRAVADKNMGPLVNTVMTRCIHCTRCVRFATEVAGVDAIGLLGRGEHAEISTIEQAIDSELSGNLIDLCPVGALTSKPYKFHARPWELVKTESIDVLDAMGANIRIDSRGNEVLRILPRLNEDINEEWISDKTRFACDGLKNQRLDKAYHKESGKFHAISNTQAIDLVGLKISSVQPDEIAVIAGNQVDCENLFALKSLFGKIGATRFESRIADENINGDVSNYIMNSQIKGIESADFILLAGINPRKIAPVLNARIRKIYLTGKCKIYYIGADKPDLTYKYTHLGQDISVLNEILDGKYIEGAQNPLIITGESLSKLADWHDILHNIRLIETKYGNDKPVYNYLHSAIGRIGAMVLGYQSDGGLQQIKKDAQNGKIKLVFLAGVDENIQSGDFGDALVIYQGHHGDIGAHLADIILPSAAYTEKSATYLNTEGRVQRTNRAVFAPGQALNDGQILIGIAQKLNISLGFSNGEELQSQMIKNHNFFAGINELIPIITPKSSGKAKKLAGEIHASEYNFYLSCAISRASPTMAICAHELGGKNV